MRTQAENGTIPLRDLCEEIVDCPHSTPVWTDTGVIVLRNQNIRNGRLDLSAPSFTDEEHYRQRIRRAEPRAGDLVITREAPMGEVCEIPEGLRCCLGQRMVLLRPHKEKCNGRFLLYALQSPTVRHEIFVNEGTGSTVSNLRIPLLEALAIPNVQRREQEAIAGILGALDDKIELNRRMSRTLEGMARAIFKSWFVDFDPVRAKAAVRREHPNWTDSQVSRAACPNLKSDIAALFQDSFEDSELGEIPKGWRVGTVSDLADVIGGGTPSTKEPSYWEDGESHWATPKDLSALSVPVLLETERRITEAGVEQISSGLLAPGTVLMSSRAPIGYLAINQVPLAINQGFIAMRPKEGVSPHFLLRWAQVSQELIMSYANGSTFLEISKANFRPIALVVPDEGVSGAFHRVLSPMFERVVMAERSVRTLAAIRDALLPRLVSGELRVVDAHRIVQRTG